MSKRVHQPLIVKDQIFDIMVFMFPAPLSKICSHDKKDENLDVLFSYSVTYLIIPTYLL